MVLRCACSQIASSSSGGGGGPSRPTLNLQQQATLAATLLSSAFGMPTRGIPKRPPGPSLAQILEPDILLRYVQQPGMLERLAEYLPESQRQRILSVLPSSRVRVVVSRTQEALVSQCLSPQLHQQLKMFSSALQTGQFDPAALGLQVEAHEQQHLDAARLRQFCS